MTYREWRAKQFESEFKKFQSQGFGKEAGIASAYNAGFEEALEMAADLIRGFKNTQSTSIAIIVGGIGMAEVNDDGKTIQFE